MRKQNRENLKLLNVLADLEENNGKLKSKIKKLNKIIKEKERQSNHINRKVNIDFKFNNEMDKLIKEFPKVIKETGMTKFLLEGDSGSGKTFSVKQLCKQWGDNFSNDQSKWTIVDLVNVAWFKEAVQNLDCNEKNGGDRKAILSLTKKLNALKKECKKEMIFIIFFDEADTIFRNRINGDSNNSFRNDVVNDMLKFLDELGERIIVFAATNFEENMDFAIRRRFDYTIHFDHKNYPKKYKLNLVKEYMDKMNVKEHQLDWEQSMHDIRKQINKIYFLGDSQHKQKEDLSIKKAD